MSWDRINMAVYFDRDINSPFMHWHCFISLHVDFTAAGRFSARVVLIKHINH